MEKKRFKKFTSFFQENKVVFFMFLVYFFLFSFLSCYRHFFFQTQAYDLGIFIQSLWNTLHGNFMFNTVENLNHFGVHFSPILVFIIPFYFLFQSPYFILVLQSFALGFGVFPVYFLFKQKFGERFGLVFSLIYLIYPSLHFINLYDFHPVAFAIPFLLFSLFYIEKERYFLSCTFLFLSLICKENIAFAVFFIGLYVLIFKKKFKEGILISSFSLFWFILSIEFIVPFFGGGFLISERYGVLGNSLFEIFKNLFNFPLLFSIVFQKEKIIYFFKIFFPFIFVPLFLIEGWFLLIPGFLQNFLTNDLNQFSTFYQYDSIFIPFLFYSIFLFFKKGKIFFGKISLRVFFGDFWRKKLLLILLIFSIFYFVLFSPVSPMNFSDRFNPDPDTLLMHSIVEKIPLEVSLTVDTYFFPHLANRERIYMFGHEKENTSYILVDLRRAFPFYSLDLKKNYLENYLNSGEYSYEVFGERFFLLKKKSL